jgi:catechol 2,3-dioxygenase-like lactoylglutathione lyase family enzyme
LESAERFYRDALGLERVARYQLGNGLIVQMGPNGAPPGVELWMEQGLVPKASDTEHLAFAVDDVGAWVERIRRHGYQIDREPYAIGGETVAFVRDPDDHLIELNDFKGR